jgi:DNA-binding transcriptional MerR regulator
MLTNYCVHAAVIQKNGETIMLHLQRRTRPDESQGNPPQAKRWLSRLLTAPAGAGCGSARSRPRSASAVGVRTSALRLWEQHGLLRPKREKGTGYRVYDDAELLRARVVALLRRGGYPLAIVAAVVDEMRTMGSPERVRAELAKREQELHHRSLRPLRASAACYGHIDGHALPSRT